MCGDNKNSYRSIKFAHFLDSKTKIKMGIREPHWPNIMLVGTAMMEKEAVLEPVEIER